MSTSTANDAGAGLGGWLRRARAAAGVTQEELAERSGVGVRTIGNLECGRTRKPYASSIRCLAAALGVPFPGQARAAASERASTAADPPAVVPRQLPAPVRDFTGRQAELDWLTGLLDQASAMPVSVLITAMGGTAGVGKTALVVHWAHQVAERFPDGQLYVNLRGYDAGPPVAAADALAGFLRSLGVPGPEIPADTQERAGAYRSRIAGRRMLVVLDNARHVAQVRPLLPGSPVCVTVVTSRDTMAGLVAGDGAVRLEVDLLPLPEAVALLQRLIGSRAEDDADAAARLAGQCGRLPLALRIAAELALARPGAALAELTAKLADLQHRLDALDSGEDERTTMRPVLSWSYQTLSADAARLFRLAGLHPGPSFDQYAAAALARTSLPRADRLLDQLARAHLIQPAGPDRYGMHDLLRGYARELASKDGAGARRAALTSLFDYYLCTAATAVDTVFPAERTRLPAIPPTRSPAPALTGETAALAWLGAERPGLVAVAVHAADHGWPDHAAGLSATLYRYLDTECLYPEATTIHRHARQAARRTGDQRAEASALHSLGVIDLRQGRYQQAASHFGQALDLFRGAADRLGEARALSDLGFTGFLQGRGQHASEHLQQALAIYRSLGDKAGRARVLASLGYVDLQQGRHQEAARHLRRSLALGRDIGDQGGQARALGTLGQVNLQRGRYRQAEGHVRQALALFHAIGDRISQADALADLGIIDLRQGRYQQAADHLEQAHALSGETRDLSSQANTLNSMGELRLATGQHADAHAQHAAALDLAIQAGEIHQQARAHAGLAAACQASGNLTAARRHQQQAFTLYSQLGAPEAAAGSVACGSGAGI